MYISGILNNQQVWPSSAGWLHAISKLESTLMDWFVNSSAYYVPLHFTGPWKNDTVAHLLDSRLNYI